MIMKTLTARYVLLLLSLTTIATTLDAQTVRNKTTTTRKPTTTAKKPTTTAKKPTAQKTNTKAPTTNLAAKPVDTVPVVVAEPPRDPLKIDTVKRTRRAESSIDRNPLRERTPLAYEHIREDDAVFRQFVWREIDVREKMNQSFRYKADEDNGNQRFINILLTAIKKGDITAFSAGIGGEDDRLTTPMTLKEIGEKLVGKCKTDQIPDWTKDPDGSKGIMKDTFMCPEFNPDDIVKYMVKEEWIFDKESSRMYVRILGLAPVKATVDANTNVVLGESPVFWVYYPDLRPTLSSHEVYNGKNFGARMSWEELFESRFFASSIIKSTIENPYDQYIRQYINDPILRLLEGEAMKEKIFNYEQNLWSY
jgi:gliding motility associated protien GldN